MIQRNTRNFTGFFPLEDDKKIYFHADKGIFNFISEGVGLFAEMKTTPLESADEYIYGYTTDGYQLAVFVGCIECTVGANYKLKPNVYFIGKHNMDSHDMKNFQAVEFIGGTLNNLYEKKNIETTYDAEKKCYIRKYPETKLEYDLDIDDKKCKMIIKNIPSEITPLDMDLVIRYEFDSPISLKFYRRIYNDVKVKTSTIAP